MDGEEPIIDPSLKSNPGYRRWEAVHCFSLGRVVRFLQYSKDLNKCRLCDMSLGEISGEFLLSDIRRTNLTDFRKGYSENDKDVRPSEEFLKICDEVREEMSKKKGENSGGSR